MKLKLEICIDSLESAKAAIDGGADRLEVTASLETGGQTPTKSLLKAVRNYVNESGKKVQLYPMIRPRAGDFVIADKDELQMMIDDIVEMKAAKLADGFVLGLTRHLDNGEIIIDEENCRLLITHCSPLPVTCHRAFDVCSSPDEAFEAIINAGFSRLLTAGQRSTAFEGKLLIKKLIQRATDSFTIMPGSGLGEKNLDEVRELVDFLGAKEYHSSASVWTPTTVHSEKLLQVFPAGVDKRKVCSASVVKKLKAILIDKCTTGVQ